MLGTRTITLVATGSIGRFDVKWTVMKIFDTSMDEPRYDLHIDNQFIESFPSVLASLKALVDRFDCEEDIMKTTEMSWLENNERHCTRQFAVDHGIIAEDDTTTTCKLWWDEYIYIH